MTCRPSIRAAQRKASFLERLVRRFLDTENMAKRFGKAVLAIDRGCNGRVNTWVLTYRWRGIVYIVDEGITGPDGIIRVPKATKIIYG